MGINDEYSRDAYNYDLAYDSDESDDFDPELHPEDWQDMYSAELLDAWMIIRGFMEENYIKCVAHFPEFVDLVLHPANWYSTVQPPTTHEIMWNMISNAPIVSDRVMAENFYAWAENYIE
jgi:hypothetical protein